MQRSKTAYAKAAGLYQRGAYVPAAFGFAFLKIRGVEPGANTFFLVMGAVMFAAAVFQYRSGQRRRRQRPPRAEGADLQGP